MDYLLDTNIIIQILKGNSDLVTFIKPLNTFIDVTVYVKTIQGQKSNSEKIRVKKYLQSFDLIFADEDILRQTINLIEKFSNSHNLLLPDALIAATCLESGFDLITYNRKDFQYIPNLNLVQPQYPQI